MLKSKATLEFAFDRLSSLSSPRWGVAKLVRRLTLDQVIKGSNPFAPAIAFTGSSNRRMPRPRPQLMDELPRQAALSARSALCDKGNRALWKDEGTIIAVSHDRRGLS